jgi:crotonobetainyl-CoA:carnitine CoA-transferase CaiB-like acyl-CoA transferase
VSPGSAPGAVQYVLLVEGLDRAELQGAAPRIIDALASGLGAVQSVAWEGYDLAFVIERSGLKWPTTARQPARPEVRERSK